MLHVGECGRLRSDDADAVFGFGKGGFTGEIYPVNPARETVQGRRAYPAVGAIGHYFGWVPTAELAETFTSYLPLDRMHAAFDDGRIIGGAGVYPFEVAEIKVRTVEELAREAQYPLKCTMEKE